ncbi:glycosyltransferase involved in cell wall biosynthesis [Antricoccus suffuscus]|uniref:Glycosyltransferase involved in cell wall biosynthesis n=1 Tax=Antricoccus suffuscus TaxID=1629062 RepID=A0A2T0ZB55_9ACTN|nr:glycosyltransferase family A protein [Antricoccus suffuscus]PRZ33573.1 glycosyltransferase involved in cell wall biosynthesis [Antricoccus suffuscus]
MTVARSVVRSSTPTLEVADQATTQSRFSVVVPAYNEEHFLGACLDSLAAQDFPGDVEIIVVDNNSTDATAAVATRPGVTVISEPKQGVCAARQAGTAAATGEIVVSTDADTTFRSDWLSTIDRSFREQPDLTAVAGPPHWVDAPRWGRVYERAFFGLIQGFYRLTGRVAYVSAANIAFRRNAWRGYDVRLTQGGDELDLLRQLHEHGTVVYNHRNAVLTSARRMDRGFLYNVFVTCFYYYLLGYATNRLLGRTAIGMAPSFRTEPRRSPRRGDSWTWRRRTAIALVVTGLAWIGWTLLL